jgi:recombination protein RecT
MSKTNPPKPEETPAKAEAKPKQESRALAPIDEIRGTIQKMEGQFKMALPSHISAEKFMRVLQTAINNSPHLVNSNRQSLLGAAMKAAQDGLLPDGREAALVTFKDQVAYMPMVAGILKKVRNSGELQSLSPHVVYENDFFDYWIDELGEHLKHKPKLVGARGEITHVYCIAITKDKGTYIEVMSKEEIDQIRDVSRSKDGGPWKQWYGEMGKKSVIRRLSKRLPMSTDLEMMIHADDEVFNPPPVPEVQREPKKKSSRLSQAMWIAQEPAPEREVSSEEETSEPVQEGDVPI